MRVLTVLLLSTLSMHAYANVNCKLRTPVTLINWTGTCTDGYADGIGELAYQFLDGKGELTRVQTFGKVNLGVPTGLHSTIEGSLPTTQFSTYYTNGSLKLTGILVAADSSNQQLPLSKRFWGATASDGHNESITYEEALNKIRAYIAQKNEPSIDFSIYKAYLEGKVRLLGEDDAPVFGAVLKPNGGSKKKK